MDPHGTGGWTLTMVKNALDRYGAAYQEWNLDFDAPEQNIQKMVEELDNGRALFCMIHEGDLDYDGHCMLVYGYEKSGDSLFFTVHDPGLGTEIDAFGRPVGQDRMLEAHYAEWITRRWSYAVLSILPLQ